MQNNYDFAFKQGFSVGLKPQLSFFKLAFDFCWFCMVICFFIFTTTANDIRLRRISIPDFDHYNVKTSIYASLQGEVTYVSSLRGSRMTGGFL